MTTSSDPQPQQQEGPERIFIHNGSRVEIKPCVCGDAIEYVRADLHRATVEADWQTIETAPDDQNVLVWMLTASSGYAVVARREFGWWLTVGASLQRAYDNPTHWRAIEPPRAWSKSRKREK